MCVEEGAVESLQFCLTVTECPGYIFGDFLVESLPVGSATSKSIRLMRSKCSVACGAYVRT